MEHLSWKEAQTLREFYLRMVDDVNHSFRKSFHNIECLLVVPSTEEGKLAVFNNYLHTKDPCCEQLFANARAFHVIAVIKDEGHLGRPYYFYRHLNNVLTQTNEA